mmetsp:Transcript_17316/g.47031  ORF Transcript_17316/g.47031 Transcript_17316/m.47031 type:complete len:259 (+) Transcript_17316:599-1375(+)
MRPGQHVVAAHVAVLARRAPAGDAQGQGRNRRTDPQVKVVPRAAGVPHLPLELTVAWVVGGLRLAVRRAAIPGGISIARNDPLVESAGEARLPASIAVDEPPVVLRGVADDRVGARLYIHRSAFVGTGKSVGAADPGVLGLGIAANDVQEGRRRQCCHSRIEHEGVPLALPEVPLQLPEAGVRRAQRLRVGATDGAALRRRGDQPPVLRRVVPQHRGAAAVQVGGPAVAHLQELVLAVDAGVLGSGATADKREHRRGV